MPAPRAFPRISRPYDWRQSATRVGTCSGANWAARWRCCGARGLDAALAVAKAVRGASHLQLVGVACYEGIVLSQDPEVDRATVNAWLEDLAELARRCEGEGLFETEEVILSAGGSAYFDLVAKSLNAAALRAPSRVLLRSGCYLTHDAGHY